MVTIEYEMPNKATRRATTLEQMGLKATGRRPSNEPYYEDEQGYRFTNCWFQRDIRPLWEAYRKAKVWPTANAESYLEIGVCEGASLLWMLDAAPELKSVVGIDPYAAPRAKQEQSYDEHQRLGSDNITKHQRGEIVVVVQAKSSTVLPALLTSGNRFDLIYVDGDHNAPEAMRDMVMSWDLLKRGGVMCVDDTHRRWHLGKPHVHEAVRGFLEAFEKAATIVYRGPRQILLQKP